MMENNSIKHDLKHSLNKIVDELVSVINVNVINETLKPKHKVGDIVYISSPHGPLQMPIHSITHLHTKDGIEYSYSFEGYTSLQACDVFDTMHDLALAQIEYWKTYLK